jgi:hypothetical protein
MEDFSLDWISSPIYDTNPDKKESLEKVNLFDTVDNFANESFRHHVLDKSPEEKPLI